MSDIFFQRFISLLSLNISVYYSEMFNRAERGGREESRCKRVGKAVRDARGEETTKHAREI